MQLFFVAHVFCMVRGKMPKPLLKVMPTLYLLVKKLA